MGKYKRKAIIVDAWQYQGGLVDSPEWLHSAINDGELRYKDNQLYLHDILVDVNDYIVMDNDGYLDVYTPAGFAEDFEPVTPPVTCQIVLNLTDEQAEKIKEAFELVRTNRGL